jgi:hypothetical protein
MGKTWRESCRPLIAEVLKQNEGRSLKDKRKALKLAYPWGERAMHPYKIWCDEVKVQLGLKKKKVRGETNDPHQLDLI